MKVSVITVCFNAQDTIGETIQNVLNQTYEHIEYIIVDGKSTDNTISIVNKYYDHIAVLISEKDNGVYDAMNKGISLATGDIIFFLNSGDLFFDNRVVENVVEAFKTTSVDIIYGDVIMLDPVKGYNWIKVHEGLDKVYFYGNTICHQGIFFKTCSFKRCGLFDLNYKISADYEWLLRAFFRHRLKSAYTNLIISVFLLDGISSHPKFEEQHMSERREIQRKYFSSLERFVIGNGKCLRLMSVSVRSILRKVFPWKMCR